MMCHTHCEQPLTTQQEHAEAWQAACKCTCAPMPCINMDRWASVMLAKLPLSLYVTRIWTWRNDIVSRMAPPTRNATHMQANMMMAKRRLKMVRCPGVSCLENCFHTRDAQPLRRAFLGLPAVLAANDASEAADASTAQYKAPSEQMSARSHAMPATAAHVLLQQPEEVQRRKMGAPGITALTRPIFAISERCATT
jgi:hypothetical protein